MRTRAIRRVGEQGSIPLMMAVSVALTVGGFVATVMTVTSNEVFKARQDSYRIRSEMIADLGLEEGVAWVHRAQRLASLNSPFAAFDSLSEDEWTPIVEEEAAESEGQRVGTYSVWARLRPGSSGNALARDIEIRSLGRFDVGEGDLAYDEGGVERRLVARSEMAPAELFDYSYFLNNWGWFYGDSIVTNGNVRSNGQFDAGDTAATVNGTPRYRRVIKNGTNFSLQDKQDDGGVYSGWDIVGTGRLRGMGATAANQYEFQETLEMPNLTELGLYESLAKTKGSTVRVSEGLSTARTINAVFGDDSGESGNLYLVGTTAKPIVINGPIVARGHVFIKGVVSGQGAIYAGGNIYVGDDVTYLNPPATTRPTSNDKSVVEAWISANATRDTLGLYAREHIVIGNQTTSDFQNYVNPWLSDTRNQSKEDSGKDNIPNTKKGRDGVAGTDDDDALEGNNTWDVERYTAEHAAQGLIPAGRNVGDAIPGSGEDIDGDGKFDGTTAMTELAMSTTAWNTTWGGNKPSGRTYAQESTNNIARLDAAFYTNHTLAARVVNSGGTIQWNGSMVARNEAIVYTASRMEMNHDARLYGGGELFHYNLPKKFMPIRTWPVFSSESGAQP
ncbi:MAG: hypothetical protein JNM84_20440 [Planctomycetes bacterium]|nr:hypothetical protein [Planctomycetota bacterium]